MSERKRIFYTNKMTDYNVNIVNMYNIPLNAINTSSLLILLLKLLIRKLIVIFLTMLLSINSQFISGISWKENVW